MLEFNSGIFRIALDAFTPSECQNFFARCRI